MNPTLGMLLPLMLAQPPLAVSGPGCGACPPAGPIYPNVPAMLQREICPPVGPPAPVLAVQAVLPGAATVSVPTGAATDQSFANGSVFGFRPGYFYRLKIDNLPDFPGESLYPSLEVRGSIVPRPGMKYMEYPASLYISKTDVEKAVAGGVVTKVIFLEDPEKAVPFEAKPDNPIEVTSLTEEDALRDAESSGRVVAILRIGAKPPTADEIAHTYLPGTVLLPGQAKLGLPPLPPPLKCHAVPLYDPILGPKASTEECILNGGDTGPRIGIGPGGSIGNLNPTDAAVEYTIGQKRKTTVSNTVCICAPRFVLRRVEQSPSALFTNTALDATRQVVSKDVFVQREAAQLLLARERTLTFVGRGRPAATVGLTSLHAVGALSKPKVFARVDSIEQVVAVVEPDELTAFPARLILTKTVDPTGPVKSGDVLTVTLKFVNNTRQAVTDLVISDSLSGRLEYVDGSAGANVVSNVTKVPNEAGSVTVRFDVPGPIEPSGSGLVVFKVKVR